MSESLQIEVPNGANSGSDEVRHEYNWWGTHRLVVNGVKSEWTPYNQPVMHAGYMALTQYWGDKERVFRVTPLPYIEPISACTECGKEYKIDSSSEPEVPWKVYQACEHIIDLLREPNFSGFTLRWEDLRS